MWLYLLALSVFAALIHSLPLPAIWGYASLLALALPTLYLLYKEFFMPINETYPAVVFGAGATQRIAGQTPPPYPNGWYVRFGGQTDNKTRYLPFVDFRLRLSICR